MLKPAAPETGDLVHKMPRLHVLAIGQHQIRLERVVGVFHIGAGRLHKPLVHHLGCGRGSRCLHPHHRRFGNAGHGLQIASIAVDFSQVLFNRLGHWAQHQLLHSSEVLLTQVRFDGVALVQAHADRQGTVCFPFFQLANAVMKNRHRLHAPGQIHLVALQLNGAIQISGNLLHQLPVGQIGRCPPTQGQRQHQHSGGKCGCTQATLAATGVLLDQLFVGEHHL